MAIGWVLAFGPGTIDPRDCALSSQAASLIEEAQVEDGYTTLGSRCARFNDVAHGTGVLCR